MDECVFCTRRGLAATLFETAGLYVMPDMFPVTPGHVLIISKAHLACYAAAPHVWQELEEATGRVRRFLEDAYGRPVMGGENGIAGQTVHHAHLHLLPMLGPGVPPGLDEFPDVVPIEGWAPVREHLLRCGGYRYHLFGEERRLIAADSPAIDMLEGFWQQWYGASYAPEGPIRTTTPEDVREVGRRWAQWAGAN